VPELSRHGYSPIGPNVNLDEWRHDIHLLASMIHYGRGTPEGVVPAPPGHIFLDYNGTGPYRKVTGKDKTGWLDLSPSGWTDAQVSLGGLNTTGKGVPAFEQINSSGAYGYALTDEAVVGNEKELICSTQLSHAVQAGSELRFHVHAITENAPGADQVFRLGAEYITFNRPGDVATAARTTTDHADIPVLASWDNYRYGIFDVCVVIDEDLQESTVFQARLFRNSSHANDTYAGEKVWLVSADGHIYQEKGGTVDEYPS